MTDDDDELGALDFDSELSDEEKVASALIAEFDRTLAELRDRHENDYLTEEQLVELVVGRYKDRPQEELKVLLAIAISRKIQAENS